MSEFSSILNFLQSGSITGWALVFIGLTGLWKMTAIVPALMDAWERRNNGIEARLQAGMKAHIERTNEALEEADKAHRACQEETGRLRDRINQQDTIIARLNDTIATQSATIAESNSTIIKLSEEVTGLRRSHLQTQVSMVEERDAPLSPQMKSAVAHLKEIR